MKNIGLAALFATVILGMPLLPLLAQGQAPKPSQMPAMHQMAMSGMMEKCQEHCKTMSSTLDDMARTIATAKQSKDVAALHASLDQIAARLAEVRQQMASCKMMGQSQSKAK